jgi:HEAT repeats
MKRSLLHVLPIFLLSCSQIFGQIEMARSEVVVQQQGSSIKINMLIKILKTGSRDDRWAATKELARFGKTNFGVVLSVRPLLKDSDKYVRSGAAFALGTIGESAKSAIPELVSLLKDSEPYVSPSAYSITSSTML